MEELKGIIVNNTQYEFSLDVFVNDDATTDLNISDESDNVIVKFNNGHIKTLKFNSANIPLFSKGSTYDQSPKIIIADDDYDSSNPDMSKVYMIVDESGLKVKNIQILSSSSNNSSFVENSNVLEGITNYQRPVADINMIAIYGQSLSTGLQSCPELSRTNYKGNLMIGDYEWVANMTNIDSNSTFNLLHAKALNQLGNDYIPSSINDLENGETCGVNYCNAAKKLIDDHMLGTVDDRVFLDCSFGAGGKSIEELSKNCPNTSTLYSNLESAMTIINNKAEDANKSVCCTAVVWMLGEWNEDSHEDKGWYDGEYSTDDKDDYKAYFLGGITTDNVTVNGMVNDLINTIQTTFGQEYPPLILGNQHGTHYIRHKELPIMMAQLEASNESDKYILCTPTYRVTDRGGHIDSNGERWLGELYAKVWYKKVILGQDWKPLLPIKISKSSNNIEIEFHVPEPPLVFDQNLVRAVSNYGFKVYDNNVEKLIADVNILGNKVIITTSDVLLGDVEVTYAGQGVQYGNLRDSDPWKAFEVYKDLDTIVLNPEGISYRPSFEPKDENGNVIYNKPYPCLNFCVQFYYKLLLNQNELIINI